MIFDVDLLEGCEEELQKLAERLDKSAAGYITLSRSSYCVPFSPSQIFEYSGRCVAISEPDSPNYVATKYRNGSDTPEIRQFARDIIRWECRPYPSLEPLAYALKLTAPSAVALPMLV